MGKGSAVLMSDFCGREFLEKTTAIATAVILTVSKIRSISVFFFEACLGRFASTTGI